MSNVVVQKSTMPKGWEVVKLGDICDIFSGGTPKTGEPEFWNGDIPWLAPPDFTNAIHWVSQSKKSITELGLKKSATRLLQYGDVIISARGTVGALAQIKKPMAFSQTNYGLRANPKIADAVFFFYAVKNSIKKIKQFTYGAVFDTITTKTFNHIHVFLPSIIEQKAIAELLSSLDDKIDLLYRQNKILETMAQTLFRKWFIENVDDRWEETPLETFFDFLEGPGIRNWQYTETGTRFINIRLMKGGDIVISKSNFISNEEANTKYKHFQLQEKDMIVSTSATLGITSIVRKHHLPLLLNTSVIRFRPKDGVNYSFMYQYLQSTEFQNQIHTLGGGSVQTNFGPTHLKTMKLKIPPSESLKAYRKYVDNLYIKRSNNLSQINTLEDMRDFLLPKLMSGKIRISLKSQEIN